MFYESQLFTFSGTGKSNFWIPKTCKISKLCAHHTFVVNYMLLQSMESLFTKCKMCVRGVCSDFRVVSIWFIVYSYFFKNWVKFRSMLPCAMLPGTDISLI